MVVTPPSTSNDPTLLPALVPVTSASEPDIVVPLWRDVADGLPRCHAPPVAVSVPSGFVTQPPYVSKSSYSAPQSAAAWPMRAYGQLAASISIRMALRLRAVWGAIT